MFRPVLIAFMSATLGACVSQGPVSVAPQSLEAPVRAAFASASPGDGQVLIRLPETAGPIHRVRNNNFANGFHQVMEFGRTVPGMKQNAVDLRLQTQTTTTAIEPLAIERPTEAMIRAELAAQFPKMEMRVVDQPRRNAAGTYGLAVGRWDNGTRCLYAWQWIDQPRIADASVTYDAAMLRVRLCDSTITLDQIAAIIDEIQLAATPFTPTPIATAKTSEPAAVKPKPRRVAEPAPPPSAVATRRVAEPAPPRSAVPTRHAAWESAALGTAPAIQASERPADAAPVALDPTLPAEAFRGPAAARKTSK